ICLITAPVSTDYEDSEQALSRQVQAAARAPKLGVLALASAQERAGMRARVFDLDDAYAAYLTDDRNGGLEGFPAWVGGKIVSSGARLFGFSSICSSYPVTIRIAEIVKRQAHGCTILLGGPQASVTDMATLSAFPFVDFILRGEADLSLPAFVKQWSGERRFSEVAGLTWRSPFGPQRNSDAPVIANLDDLPLPAFHLCPNVRESPYAFLELGRGCPFACTFCSTNDFFRRKFRVKSPRQVLAEMRQVASEYGFLTFNLVHDMFTVDRRKVVAFCDALIEAGEGFRWSCSARTDCIDRDLLERMARAGCISVFFGVETGSPRMQRIIDKNLDLAEARVAVETAERLGMETTVSLITGFPEESEDDMRETVGVFMHSLSHAHSLPQLNILAPLSGTPIHQQYKDQIVLGDLSSQLSYPGRSQSDADRALVRDHPEIFPNFYLLPTPGLDRAMLQELAEFLPMCRRKVRWLLVALHQRCSDILQFFHAWRQHRIALHPDMGGGSLRLYYVRDTSKHELVAFLRERLAEFDNAAVEALVTYQEVLSRAVDCAPAQPAGPAVSGRVRGSSLPVRASGLHVIELNFDIQNVVDSLKGNAPLSSTPIRKYYRTASVPPEDVCLLEVTPLVGRSLLLCDGTRTVEDFEAQAALLFECREDLRRYAARRLLKQLRDEGLIEIYRRKPRIDSASTTRRQRRPQIARERLKRSA
ncbi:MAG: radical SAM protein, partial [Bryobacteraceae bacterium]